MNTYAIININTNKVDNIILWDGISDWSPPTGYICIEVGDSCDIDDLYVDGVFIKPESSENSNT